MKLTKSIATKTANPTTLFGDLVLEIHNERLSIYDVRNFLSILTPNDIWGFIVPRRTLTALNIPYEIAEMNYDEMLSDPHTSSAVIVYQRWDAVMIKPPEKSNVILQ